MTLKGLLLGSGAWLLAVSPALAQTPMAQTSASPTAAAPPAESTVGEVIVTANKRQENIQKVGQTITAIGGPALAERHLTTLQDIASAVPGLSFTSSTANTPIYTLRGVGFNESSLAVYPAVSVYVDEIPLPFPVLASHSAYDLDRIEVLKGPQGTLFGENSTGGAINYIAAKPTGVFGAGADLTYGRFNQVQGDLYVNGPITQNLDGRLSLTADRIDGWQKSYTREDTNGAEGYFAGRMALKWTPTDRVRVNFNLNGWRDTSQPEAQQLVALVPSAPAFVSIHQAEVNYPLSPLKPQAADWSTDLGRPRSSRDFIQGGLRVDADLSPAVTLTSLTSYNYYHQVQATDGDGMNVNSFDLSTNNGNIHSFNQELRLANANPSAVRWVVGANYENSQTSEDQILQHADGTQSNPGTFFIATGGVVNRQKFENYAVFGNVEYDIIPDLTIKGGARYTSTKDQAYICGYSPGPLNSTTQGQIPLFELLGQLVGGKQVTLTQNSCYTLDAQGLPGTPFMSSLSQNNVSWRGGIDYKGIQNTLLYVNVSRGYKAGSFPSLAAGTVDQLQPVVQEEVQAYEGGFKTQLLDHHLQFNGALFYYDYSNKQVRGKLNDLVFGPLDVLVNIPKSRIMGAEADVVVRPIDGLTLSASATYLDSEVQAYTGYNVLGTLQNFSGISLPDTPRWSVGMNADYRWTLANGGSAFVGLSADARSQTDGVLGGSRTAIPVSPINRIEPGVSNPLIIDGYTTLDARLGYNLPGDRWKVMLWGKNILNSYYWNNVVASNDSISRVAAMPATYGVTLTWKY